MQECRRRVTSAAPHTTGSLWPSTELHERAGEFSLLTTHIPYYIHTILFSRQTFTQQLLGGTQAPAYKDFKGREYR